MPWAPVRPLPALGAPGHQGQLRGGAGALCWASPHAHTHPSPQNNPQGWKVRGREEQQGAPDLSEGLQVTQKSEQKGQKIFTL